jgi:hypothetical protein
VAIWDSLVEPLVYSQRVHPFLAPLAVRSARVACGDDRPDRLGVPAMTWLLVIFALLVPGGGFTQQPPAPAGRGPGAGGRVTG